jgi:hypothetical protein
MGDRMDPAVPDPEERPPIRWLRVIASGLVLGLVGVAIGHLLAP